MTVISEDGASVEMASAAVGDVVAHSSTATEATLRLLRGSQATLLELERGLDAEQLLIAKCVDSAEAASFLEAFRSRPPQEA